VTRRYLALCISILWITGAALAQPEATQERTGVEPSDALASPPPSPSANADSGEDPRGAAEAPAEAPAPRQKRLRKAPPRYAKSRLTLDRTEAEADHRSLVLAAGTDKIVDLDPSFKLSDQQQRIMIGNITILQVVPVSVGEQKQLVFKPIAEGETNVTIRDASGNVGIIFEVVVAKQNQVRFLERLKENLKEVEGITLGIEDKNIVIRGEVLTVSDYGMIYNEIADKSYGENIINKVTMSPITLGILAKKIESDLQGFAPTVNVSVLNGKVVLGGTVDNPDLKARCEKRAFWYLPQIRVREALTGAGNVELSDPADKRNFILQSDIVYVPPPPKRDSKLVRLTIYFVELSKDFLKTFGFKWQPGFTSDPSISIGQTASGGTGTGTAGFSFSATLSSLFPTLSAPPSSASFGRILKSGTVVVKSGFEARMEDTMSLPVQTLGANGQVGVNTTDNRVAFSISMTPTILQKDDLEIDLKVNQSNQVGKGVGGTPIVATHVVNTRIFTKSGEVSAVAAVNKQDVSTSFNRDDPKYTQQGQNGQGTAQSSALFSLLRSKNMSKAKGQFVLFLNSNIIENASDGTEDLKKNFRMTSNSH
jgi:hypothetical protein